MVRSLTVLIDRHASVALREAMADTPIVVIQGARQVGKSTLASMVLDGIGAELLTLDDPQVRAGAMADPVGFLDRADGCIGIDEVQLEPGLIGAIKANVDRDRRPGRFLLTGSADLLRVAGVQDSLAGRAETVVLGPLSQGELRGRRESFIDEAFAASTRWGGFEELGRADYLAAAVLGGYPEVRSRPERNRRRQWFSSYVERIVRRDAIDLGGVRRVELLARLLRVFAARGCAELNMASLANELGAPATTLPPYVDLLEMVYLVTNVPAWSRNLGERVIRRPKIAVSDTGLMASLANLDTVAMKVGSRGSDAAGGLLEAFVIGELTKAIPWSATRPRLFFFRDRDGREIDVVLEADDGRVVGIEVKAASSVALGDFRHLRWLRDTIGDDFSAGIVLNTGRDITPFGDRLVALPISALWSGTP